MLLSNLLGFHRSCIILHIIFLVFPASAYSDEPIKVGVISPFSGPYAHFGEAGRAGIELAEKEFESSNLKFLYEDSQFQANQALNAAIKLIQVDKVDILIVLGTPTSSAVLPFSLKNNIPTFIWSASGDLSRQYANSIRLMSTGSEQGDVIAKEAIKRNYKKVSLVASENGYSRAVIDGVISSPTALLPVSTVFYSPTQNDFNIDIMKLKRLEVDGVGICLNTGQIPAFLKQLYVLNFKGGIFGCNAMSSPEVLKSLAEYGLKAWTAEGVVDSNFYKKFKEKWADTSGIWEAAGYYDAAKYLSKYGINELVGKCLDSSSFGRSCIRSGKDGKYLEYKMGVTLMQDMEFVRQ